MRQIINNADIIENKNETTWLYTLKVTINLLSHVFSSLVVVICVWFSCRSTKLTVIELHIVLCVLGYQLLMSQGILALSNFNSWSIYFKRRHRRCIHWALEFIGAILAIVGSIEVIIYKQEHFNTLHGILGLCAFIATMISIFNGTMTSLATKISSYGITGIGLTTASKCVHGVTGIATLFLAAGSLHYGYDKGSFRKWINNENFIIVLKIFTWFFTICVGFEFWIILVKRIKCKNIMPVDVSNQN
ncbi:uncharacterized protein LOC133527576 [Cydia pomonella]|uniref:uncharacterized protein LOC133527576 n=1 Tax=Cydia pomonella TaxID=82600 RepID=UPI002ADE47D0|nr:uncharacterized protein LOC133527576 [Cydia pomonella]